MQLTFALHLLILNTDEESPIVHEIIDSYDNTLDRLTKKL